MLAHFSITVLRYICAVLGKRISSELYQQIELTVARYSILRLSMRSHSQYFIYVVSGHEQFLHYESRKIILGRFYKHLLIVSTSRNKNLERKWLPTRKSCFTPHVRREARTATGCRSGTPIKKASQINLDSWRRTSRKRRRLLHLSSAREIESVTVFHVFGARTAGPATSERKWPLPLGKRILSDPWRLRWKGGDVSAPCRPWLGVNRSLARLWGSCWDVADQIGYADIKSIVYVN